MTESEFLTLATAAALASSQTSGLPPGITVAQAALESAWGTSLLARRAQNYFGIKTHRGLPWIALPTLEYRNGRAFWTEARFTRYASIEECFADRDRIILTVACYADARACTVDPEVLARALARHWATDPHYADKLLKVYRDNRLDRCDHEFAFSPPAAASSSC